MMTALALGCAACTTTAVNFDTLPNGAPVVGQSTHLSPGDAADPGAIVSGQYASIGATFSSGSPGVLAVTGSSGGAPSPPNAACPLGPNNKVSLTAPTTIKISTADVCDVWVTITASSGSVMMIAYDAGGNTIGTAAHQTATLPNPSPGAETLHINACTIDSIVLTQQGTGTYCFDDVKWRHWIWD